MSFWILLLVEFILLLALVEYEKPELGFLSLLGVGILLKVFADVNLLFMVVEHPWHASLGALVYLVIGTAWSIFKWYFFVRNRREEYFKAKEDFQKDLNQDRKVEEWEKSYEKARFLNRKKTLEPLPGENKSRILMWMAYWPWSAIWTLINDSIKKTYKFIYENISGVLTRISRSVFKDVE